MIVIMDVEEPYNDGVINIVLVAGNDRGGVEIQTGSHDLEGLALTMLTAGGEPSEVNKRILERIKESATIIMEEEYGDNVCKEV